MNIDKRVITDLFEVIRSQHQIIASLVASDQALVETLANDPALSNFASGLQKRQEYALKNPRGSLAQALGELRRTLDAVGETLKADIGDWKN